MSKIRIKNFGPIRDGFAENDGWMDIAKVTVFIGNQGSGKSTVAKLISSFTWMEKALVRGDYDKKWFERKNKLKNQFLNYHRIEHYLRFDGKRELTEISYQGQAYHIYYENGVLSIDESTNTNYPLPQIMYVPAERNFISYVKSPKELKLSSESLKEFLTEFDNAKDDLKGSIKLPINNVEVEYDKLNDILNIKGSDYKVRLTDSSSGFQSLVPLFLVSEYLSNSVHNQGQSKDSMTSDELNRFKKGVADIWSNVVLTDEQKRAALSVLSSKFNKTAFINIVEELEQNLFPISQWDLLKKLLEYNNLNEGNKLVLTTHSPYIVNFLTLAVKADIIKQGNLPENAATKLADIVPLKSTIHPNDLAIYELDEVHGKIDKLGTYAGLPSDENELNTWLGQSNELFAQLLEIQQTL